MRGNPRNSGIDVVGYVPWGTHICQFYKTKEDLLDILIPFFKAGLENNEFCLWITSQPVEIKDAKEALRKVMPDLDIYLERGQIEIISYFDWFIPEGVFDSERILKSWVEKHLYASKNGYDGVRLSGNTFWLEKGDWKNFVEYKKRTDDVIDSYQMIALCTYSLDRYNPAEIIDLVVNHKFVLIKREGKWERIESSKRRKAEEAVIQVTKNWEQTLDIVPDLIAIIDNEFKIVRVNRALAAKLSLKPENCLGLTCYSVIHGTNMPPSYCPYMHMLKEGSERTVEYRENRLDGDFMVSVSPLHDSEGALIGCIHIFRDITEHKKLEKNLKKAHQILEEKVKERTAELEKAYHSLKKSEESLAEAQKIAHIGNWEWDIATDKAYWSEEMYSIFKRDPKKLAPSFNEHLSYIHPDDLDYYCNSIKKAEYRSTFGIEHRIVLANGEERTVHLKSEFILNDANIPIRVKGTVQDITERKKSEEKLRISEEKYRNIVETANEGILMINDEASVTYVNQKLMDMTGYTLEESICRPVWNFVSKEHKAIVKMGFEKRYQDITDSRELKLICKDGSALWMFVNAKPLFDKDGMYTGSMIMLTDTTKRKEAEEALAKIDIARKKEIHHRIKNNLQVINSLLDLQADKFYNRKNIRDSEVLEAFRESQDRIISMALIHEKLYKDEGIDTLDISSYIEELTNNLFLTYKLRNTGISLNMDLEGNIFLGMDTAVPLGIIVNELVTNSLKHAFKGRDSGEIKIKFNRERTREEYEVKEYKNTSFTLIVSDNGIGIPDNFDVKNLDTLGFQLAVSLVDQLGGKFIMRKDNGTEFIMKFIVTENMRQAS
jgi:PAS domain S-box-containing protein